MIKELSLRNFRSIERADIRFPGNLAVIIGSNGTGKTNVLLALSFITNCLQKSPIRAIQLAGGLNQVFRVKERRSNECSFTVVLVIPDREQTHRTGVGKIEMKDYAGSQIKYEFAIRYEDKDRKLKISKEKLWCFDSSENEWRLIRSRDGLSQDKLKFKDEESLDLQIEAARSMFELRHLAIRKDKQDSYNERDSVLVYLAYRELANLVGFNFYPNVLRRESDLLSFDSMGYHGHGFSSLIFRLLTDKSFFRRLQKTNHNLVPRNIDWSTIALYQSYSVILPFIKKIVPSEVIDSTLVNIRFQETHTLSKDYSVAQLSDGSVKFLATSTAIALMNYSVLCIEEIENYLNPKAIHYLIDMMKDASKEFNVQFILTTHSETVLNKCTPDQVILSYRKENGTTSYRNPGNSKTINDELEAGGFGLGTYWGHGGIE